VQRLLRALSRKAAEQMVAQEVLGEATIAAPLLEQAGKATWHGRSVEIGSTAAMAPSG
jgi:hypothetical protein